MDKTTDEILASAVERMKRRRRLLMAVGAVASVLLFFGAVGLLVSEIRKENRRQELVRENELSPQDLTPLQRRPIESIPTFAESIEETLRHRRGQTVSQAPAQSPNTPVSAAPGSPSGTDGETADTGEQASAVPDRSQLLRDFTPDPTEDPAERFLPMVRETVERLAKADTPEEQLLWLRHPEAIGDAVRRYFEQGGHANLIESVTAVRILPLGVSTFVMADAVTPDGLVVEAVFERVDDKFLLDWESLTHSSTINWSEFRADPNAPPTDFLVLASLSSTYAGVFQDGSHVAARLQHPREGGLLYGYFRRDDPAMSELRSLLELSGEGTVPVILRLSGPGPEGRSQQVVIEKVLGNGWIRM